MLWWFKSNGAIASGTNVQMAANALVIAKLLVGTKTIQEPNVPLDIFKITVSSKMYNSNTFHLTSLKQQYVPKT